MRQPFWWNFFINQYVSKLHYAVASVMHVYEN